MMNARILAGVLVLVPRIASLVMRFPRREPQRVNAGEINGPNQSQCVRVANHFRAPDSKFVNTATGPELAGFKKTDWRDAQ